MISVCMATYNGERYIYKQIKSIIQELTEEDEIIISDDGSTDSTIQIIKEFNDSRIKIIQHIKTKTSKYKFDLVTRNIENAIKHSNGDIIFLADQDDIWINDKIDKIKSVMKDYDVVLHDCSVIDDNCNILIKSYFDLNNSHKGIIRNLTKNSYMGCCMAFKKEMLDFLIPFPKIEVPHDIWIGLIGEYFGKVCFLKDKLVLYRRHGNNLSPSGESSNNSFLFKIKYRFLLIKGLISRIIKMRSINLLVFL